jgi:hypothetical protein
MDRCTLATLTNNVLNLQLRTSQITSSALVSLDLTNMLSSFMSAKSATMNQPGTYSPRQRNLLLPSCTLKPAPPKTHPMVSKIHYRISRCPQVAHIAKATDTCTDSSNRINRCGVILHQNYTMPIRAGREPSELHYHIR